MPSSTSNDIVIISTSCPSVATPSLIPLQPSIPATRINNKLAVADISRRQHVSAMGHRLRQKTSARCFIDFDDNTNRRCLMTLSEDGFVWNQEAFLQRSSPQYRSVARFNPYMKRMRNRPSSSLYSPKSTASGAESDSDDDNGELILVDTPIVHEIR